MRDYILSTENLRKFLRILIEKRRVMAPKNLNGAALWGEVNSSEECDFKSLLPRDPLKKFFFLQKEELLRYDRRDGLKIEEIIREPEELIIIGSRPCDANSLRSLEGVFLQEPSFKPYKDRKDRALIISISCEEPDGDCFCTSFGIAPDNPEGSDILLTKISEKYFVEAITKKGEDFISQFKEYFRGAEEKERREREHKGEELRRRIRRRIEREKIKEILDNLESFSIDTWKGIGRRCIGCGICTFLCPTCHCFDIVDEAILDSGRRWKIWDACQFREFTLEASGHNPREIQYKRYRNRVFCKFKYYQDFYDNTGCVGCGRCIRYCPVGIDISEVANMINQGKE